MTAPANHPAGITIRGWRLRLASGFHSRAGGKARQTLDP